MQANSGKIEINSQSVPVWVGLDIGTQRTGIACSDPTCTLASPISIIPSYPLDTFHVRLLKEVAPRQVVGLVVGLPLETTGKEGMIAAFCRELGTLAAQALGVDLHFADERYSSRDAYARRQEAGFKAKRIRRDLDAYAAAAILQAFLDHNPTNQNP